MTALIDQYVVLWREPHTHPQHVRTYTDPTHDNAPVATRLEQLHPAPTLSHVIDEDQHFQDWQATYSEEPVAVRVDVVQRQLGWVPVSVS